MNYKILKVLTFFQNNFSKTTFNNFSLILGKSYCGKILKYFGNFGLKNYIKSSKYILQ